ncbi:hypothetical protein BOTCAL_0066g00260 [Botryotinia calthae]|uniref:REJ domain-containing protein n=1 Tax=Botryotinia calthae TaxID=38488 RepID=A0A4Y8D9S6_9HELO|nr:hypothetical protein BOTCAL_0066g00260 [Botryotinia calthae]
MICASFNNAIFLFVIFSLAFLFVAQGLPPIPSPEPVATTLPFSSGFTDTTTSRSSRALITTLVIITGGFEPTVTLTIVAPSPTSTVSFTSTSPLISDSTSKSTIVTVASFSTPASFSNSAQITGSSSTSTSTAGTQTKSISSNTASPTQSLGQKGMETNYFTTTFMIVLGLIVTLIFTI